MPFTIIVTITGYLGLIGEMDQQEIKPYIGLTTAART
jgi:hypothetical protein